MPTDESLTQPDAHSLTHARYAVHWLTVMSERLCECRECASESVSESESESKSESEWGFKNLLTNL